MALTKRGKRTAPRVAVSSKEVRHRTGLFELVVRLFQLYLFTADAGVGAEQKRPPRLSYSACSGPGGSRFANWANGLNGLRASWVD